MTDKTNCYGILVNDETMALIDKMNNQEAADRIAALEGELKKADDELNQFAECIAVNKVLERQLATAREALNSILLAGRLTPAVLKAVQEALAAIDAAMKVGADKTGEK